MWLRPWDRGPGGGAWRPGVRAEAQSCIDPWRRSCLASRSTQDSLFSSIIRGSSSGAGDGLLGVGGDGAAANQRALEPMGNAESRGLFGAAATLDDHDGGHDKA
ncbi:hypothetical protein KCU83_g144, partial [Aureobasidium melanogenum]